MGSEPKPLNPNAQPFFARNKLFLTLPHEIYGCEIDQGQHGHAPNMVPLLLRPQPETGFPCVYGDGQVMLLPNSVNIYQGGCWLNNNQSLHDEDAPCNGVDQLYNINNNVGVWSSTRTGKSRRTVVPPPLPVLSRSRWRGIVHRSGTNAHSVIPFPLALEEAESTETTTVMIKNIPYHYRFNDLRRILDDYCWKKNLQCADRMIWAKYDFLYLPMDYMIHARDSKLSNLGYAFVNFTTARAAFEFFQQFHGHKWDESRRKSCEVTSARLQGKEILRNIFQKKIFRSKCPKFRPVEYSPARDGFNVGMRGMAVGIYVEGLPRRKSNGS